MDLGSQQSIYRAQNISLIFEKINPREMIYKNYVIMKSKDIWYSGVSPHIIMNKIENSLISNRV